MKTGYLYDERYLDHILDSSHPESPQRLQAVDRLMHETGLLQEVSQISPEEDPDPYLRLIHTESHISGVKSIPTTGETAALAVSGVLSAVRAVCEGKIKNAFCTLRPPGHHAHNSGMEEGFCFYNNIAIAVRYSQKIFGHKKILIIDWDYHHGNGTEDAFYEDPTVLYFSTHDWFAYPGTGDPSKRGRGKGYGYNINVPLSCGATDDDIIDAWERYLVPAADEFKPDFVFISAGFDSRKGDFLGCFMITDNGFSMLTKMAAEIAQTYCNARLVSLLEGGYDPKGLAHAVVAHVGALL